MIRASLFAAVPRSGSSPAAPVVVVAAAVAAMGGVAAGREAASVPVVAVAAVVVLSRVAVLLRVAPLVGTLRGHELLAIAGAGDTSAAAATPALVVAVSTSAAKLPRLEMVLGEHGAVGGENSWVKVQAGVAGVPSVCLKQAGVGSCRIERSRRHRLHKKKERK